MYSIIWSTLAEITFADEIEFIMQKWNQVEVDKFDDLVKENLIRLSKNTLIGNQKRNESFYSVVISKQTTLYYSISDEKKTIHLILFWNNKQNPKSLEKFFKIVNHLIYLVDCNH
jgi:plasmid stabilization system protein ParE